MTPTGKVVILEMLSEAKAYREQCVRSGLDPSSATVVSLDPPAEAWLQNQGIACSNSTRYITSESHARSLRKSDEVLDWLGQRFQIEDSRGISVAYTNALVWYSRYFVHQMLWQCEILEAVGNAYPDAAIQTCLEYPDGSGGPMVGEDEKYLGWMAKAWCQERGVPFIKIEMAAKAGHTASRQKESLLKRLGIRAGAVLHRSVLRRMAKRRPLFVLSSAYRMDALVHLAVKEAPELPWTIRGGVASDSGPVKMARMAIRGLGGGRGSSNKNGQDFIGEVWPQVLERALGEDFGFVSELKEKLDRLADEVDGNTEFFSHRGIGFGRYLAGKIRNGIYQAMRRQHREIRAADELLELLKPRLVMTPFGRRTNHAIGELAQRRNIPGLLVSHGSFAPVKDDLDQKGWGYHSFGMLYGSYSHAALQTPLAEGFAESVQATSEFMKTGPLSWGWQVNRKANLDLKSKMVPGRPDCRVVMHAGTPKGRSGIHFHVYETPDEYIQGIIELIQAVEQMPNAYLIVKFRPLRISLDDLISLLPTSDSYSISVDEPFLDVMGITDLLVSFSSTTIEEALQNQVPVLLYGGSGRYQHIAAQDITPERPARPGAVYSVRDSEHLADGLGKILDVNGPAPLPRELFNDYVYDKDQITPFPDLLRQLTGGAGQASGEPSVTR